MRNSAVANIQNAQGSMVEMLREDAVHEAGYCPAGGGNSAKQLVSGGSHRAKIDYNDEKEMDLSDLEATKNNELAAGIIIMLPTILIYIFFQKYILAGVAAGAVKE